MLEEDYCLTLSTIGARNMSNVSQLSIPRQLLNEILDNIGCKFSEKELFEIASDQICSDLEQKIFYRWAKMQLEKRKEEARKLYEEERGWADCSKELHNYSDKHGV